MSDDEEDTHCPLCVEEMDVSDKNFIPCPCGYRVCMWCWHHIREGLNGLCPACRSPYNADPHAFSAVDTQEIVRKNRERKQKEKLEKKVTDRPAVAKPAAQSVADRRHLHNYRVVQRNLVYVIGLPAVLSSEDLLRKAEYFGQYGKIGKVVIHRNHSATHTTISAYVTFAYKEDAKASIQSLEGHWVDGHLLRASFGTTKYCNNFIRGMPCNNPDCVYLHDLGEDEDRFTKEEIQAGHSKLVQTPGSHQTIVTGNGGPSGTGKRCSGEPVLPPPVFLQDIVPGSGLGNSPRAGGGAVAATSASASLMTAAGKASGEQSTVPSINTVPGILQFKAAVEHGRTLTPQSSPPTPSRSLLLPPDSPTFEPLPTPAVPIPAIAAVVSPKKLAKAPAEKREKEKEKEKEKEVKEGSVSSAKEKDKEKEKEKETTNVKESFAKEVLSRQEKVSEAFRLRAAASSPASTVSISSAPLTASMTAPIASSSSAAVAVVLAAAAAAIDTDSSGLSTPKSIPESRSPVQSQSQNTNQNQIPSTSSSFDEPGVRKMPVLIRDTSTGSISPSATGMDKKMSGAAAVNGLGPTLSSSPPPLESLTRLDTANGLPLPPAGGSSTAIDSMAAIRMARSQSYNEGIAGLQPNINPGKSEALQQQAAAAAFNGLGRCAVFPVPVSSLAISVWSAILSSSSSDLLVNPFGKLLLPISELLDLTLPPVDAVYMTPWPKPLGYYMQGVGPDGASHAPAAKHVHRTASSIINKHMNSPTQTPLNQMQLSNDAKEREREREKAQREYYATHQNQNVIMNSSFGMSQSQNQNQIHGLSQQQQSQLQQQQQQLPGGLNNLNISGNAQPQSQLQLLGSQSQGQSPQSVTPGGNSLTPSQLQQQHQQLLFQQQQQQQRQNHDRQYELQQQQQHELSILQRNEEIKQAKPSPDRIPAPHGAPGISILQQMFPSVKMSFGAPSAQQFQQNQPTQPRR